MSGYNLPPGVTTNMIPGNSDEDAAWELWLVDYLGRRDYEDLTIEEQQEAIQKFNEWWANRQYPDE